MSQHPHFHDKTHRQTIIPWFVYRVLGEDRRWSLLILWKRIAATITILLITGYLAGITAFYFYAKNHKNYEFLTYSRALTVPFNTGAFLRDVGEYQLAQGIQAFEDKDYSQAFFLLRSGLRRSPDNAKGRMYLAQFYVQRQYTLAIRILEEGLEQNLNNKDYLILYFQVLLAHNQDRQAGEQAEALLKMPEAKEQSQLIAFYAATAYAYRGIFDKAEDYIREYKLNQTTDGFLLAASIVWERGNQQAAIDMLELGLPQFQVKLPIYQRLTQFHLETKNYDQARRYCILRSSANPDAFGARIDLLYILSMNGEDERKERELKSILEKYGDQQDAMQLLSAFTIQDKNPHLAFELYTQALGHAEWDAAPFAINYLKSAIQSEEYAKAVEFGERILKERPQWLEANRGNLSGHLAIAYYALDNRNLSDVHLNEFLVNRNERANVMLNTAKLFESVGAIHHARRVLLSAYDSNKRNQQILSELIRVELNMGNASNLREYLEKLLEMRRPSRELLSQAYRELASDRFIFAANRNQLLVELRSLLGQ